MRRPVRPPNDAPGSRGDWWIFALALTGIAIIVGVVAWSTPAPAHEWYPPQCCSGSDCRSIEVDDIELRPEGFFIPESGETIAYNDPRIRKTQPEGAALYHRCARGGKPDGETLCIYIPNWTG